MCFPLALLPQLISLRSAFPFGSESTVSEAAAPEVEPAECGLRPECPRELGDLGRRISKFLSQACFASMAGVWPTELNLFFLPRSGLKSLEEFGQVDCGSLMKKGLLQDGQQGVPGTCRQTSLLCWRAPVQTFVFCGPSFKTLSGTLSAWGYSV